MIVCTRCHQAKPADQFYPSRARSTGREARCIDCDNARNRQTPARIMRTRARQRATAALVAEHGERFRELYEHALDMIRDEFEMLAAQSSEHGSGPTRLRPGRYRDGEDVTDRIAPTQPGCEHCADAHATGHVCPDCGASPDDGRTGTERLDRTAFLEDVEYLLETGETLAPVIAKRIGTTVEAMCRRLHRYDRSDLIIRMDATGRPSVGAA